MEIRFQCDKRRRVGGDTTLSKRPESWQAEALHSDHKYWMQHGGSPDIQSVRFMSKYLPKRRKVSRNKLLKTSTAEENL